MAMSVNDEQHRNGRRGNVRLALVLAVVAAMFYFGIFLLKHS